MKNETTRAFSVYVEAISDAEQIGPLNLRSEWAADPDAFVVYIGRQYDAVTAVAMGSEYILTILHHVKNSRVGICSNGTADWADYDNVTTAVDDYLNDPDTFEARNSFRD